MAERMNDVKSRSGETVGYALSDGRGQCAACGEIVKTPSAVHIHFYHCQQKERDEKTNGKTGCASCGSQNIRLLKSGDWADGKNHQQLKSEGFTKVCLECKTIQ